MFFVVDFKKIFFPVLYLTGILSRPTLTSRNWFLSYLFMLSLVYSLTGPNQTVLFVFSSLT